MNKAKSLIFSFLIAVILLPLPGFSQLNRKCNTRFNGDYMLSYFPATWNTIKHPLQYKPVDWAVAGGLIAGGILVYSQDQELFTFFDRHFTDHQARNFGKFGNSFGSGLLSIPMLGGFYLVGSIKDNDRARHAALAGMQAFLLSGGAGWIIKEMTHRPRPDDLSAPDPKAWYGPFHGSRYDAFPSGHTMRAFALATVMAGVYNDKPWLGAAFYGLAGLTAYSRLVSGEHWASDVFAGAALGYGIGRAVLWFNRKKSAKCFEPSVSENGIGIRIKLESRKV